MVKELYSILMLFDIFYKLKTGLCDVFIDKFSFGFLSLLSVGGFKLVCRGRL